MGFLLMLIIYTSVGLYMEKAKPSFGHETGVILLMGISISFLVQWLQPEFTENFEFQNTFFFQCWLPLIIFASGYNMKRKKFFQNFSNISKFGLLGTLITFIIYSALTYSLCNYFDLQYYDPKTDIY